MCRSLAGVNEFAVCPHGGQYLTIRPYPVGDIKYVTASTETIYGKVSVNWKRESNKVELKVEVPIGNTAKVYLPDGSAPISVGSGKHTFKCTI